jgi:hypothetical protein
MYWSTRSTLEKGWKMDMQDTCEGDVADRNHGSIRIEYSSAGRRVNGRQRHGLLGVRAGSSGLPASHHHWSLGSSGFLCVFAAVCAIFTKNTRRAAAISFFFHAFLYLLNNSLDYSTKGIEVSRWYNKHHTVMIKQCLCRKWHTWAWIRRISPQMAFDYSPGGHCSCQIWPLVTKRCTCSVR